MSKESKTFVTVFSIVSVFTYMMFAFVQWQLSAQFWSYGARVWYCFSTLIVAFITAGIVFYKNF